jgi:N-acetylmuramoyl-L-alanine amidase
MRQATEQICTVQRRTCRVYTDTQAPEEKVNMKRVFTILLLQFLLSSLSAINADSLVRYYNAKADRFLVASPEIRGQFSVLKSGVAVYASVTDKANNIPEFFVSWEELESFKAAVKLRPHHRFIPYMVLKRQLKQQGKNLSWPLESESTATQFHAPYLPLQGIRIAIDPGHIAHDTLKGRLEQKFISMKMPQGKDSVRLVFAEGQLTWMTAAILADHLKRKGAEVMLTRTGMSKTAFGTTYEEWKTFDGGRSLDSLITAFPDNKNYTDLKSGKLKEERSYFRYVFKDVEIRRRAEEIGVFNPDFTVVIHYNVDEQNAPWTKPTTRNYCMLFVPGAFQVGELNDQESRLDFLRLLLTDEIENSISGAAYLASSFKEELKVPLASEEDAAYLGTSCLYSGQSGVYCRNLSMTRLIHGPVLYGETLYQDNEKEIRYLSALPVADALSGISAPPRVLQVVKAYEQGIYNWIFSDAFRNQN